MATLTVLKFDTANGAERALDVVKDLSKRNLINLHDHGSGTGRPYPADVYRRRDGEKGRNA